MIRQPRDDPHAGWIAVLPPPAPARPLTGEMRVEAAVVGAGLTGLAIARRLAELRPAEPVAVVEAQRTGAGASGRNAGFVVDITDFAAAMAPADRDRYLRVARFGIRCLQELVAAHAIDCDWHTGGCLRAAAGEQGLRALARWPAWLDAAGARYDHLDAAAVAAFTGSRFYRAALHLPDGITVQPAALVRGLARSLPPAVTVYEDSPVRSIRRLPAGADRGSGGFRVETGAGTLLCRRLFLATNGYTPALGFLRRRASPRWSFGSLTRQLSEGEQAALGGQRQWGVLPADPAGSTVRRTRDQRLLIRNTFHYTAAPAVPARVREAAAGRHRRALAARFPALAGVPFEHTWSGLFSTSANGQPFFGEIEPDLFSAAIYNFAGLAMGTAAGRLLADLALGADSPPLADLRQLPPPSRLPPEPLRGLDGRLTVARKNRQAGAYL